MFNPERRAERKSARQQRQQERNDAWRAANPEKAARWDAQKAAAERCKDYKQGLKDYMATHHGIASYRDVHVYADRLIRMPVLAGPESRPIAGVSAKIEEAGGISARSTLTRSAVPGMHGWQKQTDNRKGYIIIDGPDFQWQLEYAPQFDLGGARKFMTALNTAGRSAAPAAASAAPEAVPDSLDQLRKLAELRDAGIVTAEEFEAKKAKLLA